MSLADPATPSMHPGGYAELATEIRSLGLLRPRPAFYAGLFAVDLLALDATVAGLVLLRDSWWTVLLAPVLAVVSTQLGFFGHDAGHRQITRRRVPTQVLGLVSGNLLNGLSWSWWIEKHNAHHARPNDLETDPDVHSGALVFDASQTAGGDRMAASRPTMSPRSCTIERHHASLTLRSSRTPRGP